MKQFTDIDENHDKDSINFLISSQVVYIIIVIIITINMVIIINGFAFYIKRILHFIHIHIHMFMKLTKAR